MSLTLVSLDIQRHEHHVAVMCRLSDDVCLQAAIYAPGEVLNELNPAPRTFLYLAYLVALKQKTSLVVDCEVSRFEWMNFRYNFAPLVSTFYSLPQVPVFLAGATVEETPADTGSCSTGLMFSGGIDSFYTLLDLEKENQKPDYFISINAGAFPFKNVWNASFPHLNAVSREYSTPLILIDTNFHHIFRQAHLSCHTVRNITSAMLLKPAVATAVYSSSTTLIDTIFTRAQEIQDMSSIEATVLYTMQQRDFGALIYGLNAERIEKTRAILNNRIVQKFLNVCTNWRYQISSDRAVINCGECAKCARTILTLEALEGLDGFSESFDLEKFRRNRDALLSKLMQSHYQIGRAHV